MVLANIFEDVVDPAFHSGSRGLTTKRFGNMPPVDIMANLQRLYGKPSYQELDAALIRLNKTMNIMQPVEVILRLIEEVQLLLSANPDEEWALTEPNLTSYLLIKITKIGRIYAKGIEKWQKRHTQDSRKWSEFLAHLVEDYERQLTETGVTIMGQEGYGTAMHAVEKLTDGDFLTEAVTKYAERATQTEARMAQMEVKFKENSP